MVWTTSPPPPDTPMTQRLWGLSDLAKIAKFWTESDREVGQWVLGSSWLGIDKNGFNFCLNVHCCRKCSYFVDFYYFCKIKSMTVGIWNINVANYLKWIILVSSRCHGLVDTVEVGRVASDLVVGSGRAAQYRLINEIAQGMLRDSWWALWRRAASRIQWTLALTTCEYSQPPAHLNISHYISHRADGIF